MRWRNAHRDTPPPVRVIKVFLRTKTSALRAREALDLVFGGDSRVRIVYIFDPGSAFNGWLTGWEVQEEIQVLTWDQGLAEDHDLVVMATENVDVTQISGPIVVLPHGLGNNKMVPTTTGQGAVLSGLVPEENLKNGSLTLVITHPDQAQQLARASTKTIGRTMLSGDTSLSILRASASARYVERYREELGTGNRTVVLVASTWGQGSILGSNAKLLDHLLAELEADSYQVVLVAHCNVWDRDGPAELLRKLQRPLRSGLCLVRPKQWHSALVAADLVVTDHGSLALYAAMMGKPLMLGAFGSSEVVPGTPMAELGLITPRLELKTPFGPQIEAARHKHDPNLADYFIGKVVSHPDDSGQKLRDWLYSLLGLDPPPWDVDVRAAPRPEVISEPVHAYDVESEILTPRVLSFSRRPRAVRGEGGYRGLRSHLVVNEDERNDRYVVNASIIVRDRPHLDGAEAWLGKYAEHSCLIAAIATGDGRCLVRVRPSSKHGGELFILTRVTDRLPFDLLPSVVYTLMLAGHPIEGEFDVQAGSLSDRVVVSKSRNIRFIIA